MPQMVTSKVAKVPVAGTMAVGLMRGTKAPTLPESAAREPGRRTQQPVFSGAALEPGSFCDISYDDISYAVRRPLCLVGLTGIGTGAADGGTCAGTLGSAAATGTVVEVVPGACSIRAICASLSF